MRRRTLIRMQTAALLGAVLVVAPGLAASAGPVVAVGQGGDRFSPASVSVPVGGTVTWRWADSGHNVRIRSSGEAFDSGYKGAGATYSHTFTHPGVYTFVCDAHQPEMRGTVSVGGARPPTTVHRTRPRRPHHRGPRRAARSGDD